MSLNSHCFQNGQPSKLEERKKPSVVVLKRTFFRSFNFDSWPFWNQLEPRDIMYLILKVYLRSIWIKTVQGRGSTFTSQHTLVKKAILLHKMARVRFHLLLAGGGVFPSFLLLFL